MGAAFLLYCSRNIDFYRDKLRSRSNRIYDDVHLHGSSESLIGREVAMIGFGRIGRALVDLLRGFELRWLVYDPYVPKSLTSKFPVRFVGLDSLLRRAHLLVLTAALTEQTRGILSRERIARLPNDSAVINIARGGLIDLEALTTEVRRGRLRCALDVTDPLEPLPVGHPDKSIAGSARDTTHRRESPKCASANGRCRYRRPSQLVYRTQSQQPGHQRHARPDDVRMKLSFSTLACPDWTLPEIISIASSSGYDGIELRFVENEDSLWKLPAFQGQELTNTKTALSDHGLTISCVDTSCRFHFPDAKERSFWIDEGERMSDLAASLGAPGIRVFGDKIQPGADRASTRSWIAESICNLAAQTAPKGVEVWLETHGDFASAPETAGILGAAKRFEHWRHLGPSQLFP
jgi:hypothetical protein